MIIYILFVHKKSVSKRKVCIIFIKNKKFKKTQKSIFSGALRWVFLCGFFFYCQPCLLSLPLTRPGAPPFAAASAVPRSRSGARFVAPLFRLFGSAAGPGSAAAASAIAGRARTTTVLLVTTARAAIVVHHDNVVVGFSGSMLAYL